MLGSFIFGISFLVPLRLLDATQVFLVQHYVPGYFKEKITLLRSQKPFKNVFLCRSDTRMQY